MATDDDWDFLEEPDPFPTTAQRPEDVIHPQAELRRAITSSRELKRLGKVRRQDAFLEVFRVTGNTSASCRTVGISTNLVTKYWLKEDKEFVERYAVALEEANDWLEQEAFRRGFQGVDKPVIHQGMPTMLEDPETGEKHMFTVKEYSDPLLLSLMKARRPEKFRENQKVTHDVEKGGVLVVPGTVAMDDWERMAREAAEKSEADTAARPKAS
jgi:hypothetical protein